ncbi:MAG: hypothetical protein Q4B54_02965 [Coriobacteriales bacterium]|nr:hypothetical protein [Coriobacteriales bacterium]
MSQYGGMNRGHWVFLFLMPFAIGCMPYGFIMGEIMQHRTRSSARTAWRLGFFHFLVMYAVFILGIFDLLMGPVDLLYYLIWLIPSFISGLCLVIGMLVMRVEQAHSDARYGVEVSRNDPWASFFDLEWEEDSPRTVAARNAHAATSEDAAAERKPAKRRKFFGRKKAKEGEEELASAEAE